MKTAYKNILESPIPLFLLPSPSAEIPGECIFHMLPGAGSACSPSGPYLLTGQALLHQMVLGRRDSIPALNIECPTTYVKPTYELRTDLWGLKQQKRSCLQIEGQLRKYTHFQRPYPLPSSIATSSESAANPPASSDSHRNLEVDWSWSVLTMENKPHIGADRGMGVGWRRHMPQRFPCL